MNSDLKFSDSRLTAHFDPMTSGRVPAAVIQAVGEELMCRAAIDIPTDVQKEIKMLKAGEDHKLSTFVLDQITENALLATKDRRPVCGDTGLPRWYVKMGNDCLPEGGFIRLERALRHATADATHNIPLRPNRVHPLTREDHNNNLGIHAPEIDYTFEPGGAWIDLTSVQKGGLFGSDYRMLFPADGIPGLKRFFLDTMAEFGRRGLACQPAIVGMGIGGCKDTTMRIAKEAACLRVVGDRNPDAQIATLEKELKQLGNRMGIGPMGFPGQSMLMDVHVEVAHAHTGGMQAAIHTFCAAARRATARINADGTIEFRDDPAWFTEYYRREDI